ncbi:NAD-dependent epimerase/dehydratase family protein, partial [Microbacteriaceae bacterium K1510]|nr:NAD-dependent epimerase/dehydratase family protein [Microbacteriaceae bacterium K1510]
EIEQGLLTEESQLRLKLFPYRGTRAGYDDYDKILVERIFMSEPGLPCTVLRLPMVYGPGDYQHRMYSDLKRMIDNRRAIIMEETLADWRWTRGYVEDVAAAIVLAVTDERAAGHIYNVGEPEAMTMREWVES